MRKLTYWIADCLDDHECYSIRTKTKKECAEQVAERNAEKVYYGQPRKVVVEFIDMHDLVFTALGEGRIYEGEKLS